MTAYAPFNLSYPQTTPYLTTTEYSNAPTAVDTNNLVPQGTPLTQTEVLAEVIGRASSLMDKHCFGAFGSLCATQNTENARIWGNRSGQLIVRPKYWPILEVDSFAYGPTPQSMASVSPSGSTWIAPDHFIIQPGGLPGFGLNSLAGIGCGQYFCQWTYVNGWPNATLSASVAAGASAIEPSVLWGIYPGTSLTIYDAPNDEQVTVASTYVPGAATVPLVTALQNPHAAGIRVTNLPGSVKQAAIDAVSALVKLRGSGALVVSDMNEVVRTDAGGAGGDMGRAMAELDALRQIYVGY